MISVLRRLLQVLFHQVLSYRKRYNWQSDGSRTIIALINLMIEATKPSNREFSGGHII